jgi:ribosomal protein L29
MAKAPKKAASKKKVTKKSLQDMNATELTQHIASCKADLALAYRSHAARELTNTARLAELRREIARAHTAKATNQAKETA